MKELWNFLVAHGQTEPYDMINAVAQVLLALIALAALIYAVRQYYLAKKISREESRPYVIVELDRVTSGLLDLVIRNIGNSAAKNINVSFSPNIQLYTHTKKRINSIKFLKNLKFLAPNKKLSFFFGSVIGGNTNICREFNVVITYEDVEGRKYDSDQVIDPRDFLELVSISRKDIHDAAKALDEIRKELNSSNKKSEKLIGYFEKGVISRDRVYQNSSLQELYDALKNIVTVGTDDVLNTYPIHRDAEIIAKIARNKLLAKSKLTVKELNILKALNKFESSDYDFEPEQIIDEFLESLK